MQHLQYTDAAHNIMRNNTFTPDLTQKKNKVQNSLSDIAYDLIVQRIISLDYLPGQHLEEGWLVKDLSIGRTPIRETLVRLLQEGILVSRLGRSLVVRPIELHTVKSVFGALEMIEFGVIDRFFKAVLHNTLTEWENANISIQKAMHEENIFDLMESYRTLHLHIVNFSENEYLNSTIKNIQHETRRLSNFCREQYSGSNIGTLMQPYPVPDTDKDKREIISDWTPGKLKKAILEHLNSYKTVMIQIMI